MSQANRGTATAPETDPPWDNVQQQFFGIKVDQESTIKDVFESWGFRFDERGRIAGVPQSEKQLIKLRKDHT